MPFRIGVGIILLNKQNNIFVGKRKDNTKNPEFIDWKWIKTSELPEVAVDFKADVYEKIRKKLVSLKFASL